LSAGEDGTIRLWSLRGEESPLVLRGHQGNVFTAAFDPSGRHVLSAGGDGTIRLWDISVAGAASPPVVLADTGVPVYGAAFSADGNRVVGAGAEGVLVVDCTICRPLQSLIARARLRLARTLTPAERKFVAEHRASDG
jgi:WD40 repeat protein